MNVYVFVLLVVLIIMNFISMMYNKHTETKISGNSGLYTSYRDMLDNIILDQVKTFIMMEILKPTEMKNYSFDRVAISDERHVKMEYLETVYQRVRGCMSEFLYNSLTMYVNADYIDSFIKDRTATILFPILGTLYQAKQDMPNILNTFYNQEFATSKSSNENDVISGIYDKSGNTDPEVARKEEIKKIWENNTSTNLGDTDLAKLIEELKSLDNDEVEAVYDMASIIPHSTFSAKAAIHKVLMRDTARSG